MKDNNSYPDCGRPKKLRTLMFIAYEVYKDRLVSNERASGNQPSRRENKFF